MKNMLTAVITTIMIIQTAHPSCTSEPNKIKSLKELCASTIVSYRIDCSPIAAHTILLTDIEHTDTQYRKHVADNLRTTLNSFNDTPFSLRPPRLLDLDSDIPLYNRSNRHACDKCLYTMARNGITPHCITTTAGLSCLLASVGFTGGSMLSFFCCQPKAACITIGTSVTSTFLSFLCLMATKKYSKNITKQCYRHLYELPPIPLNYAPIPDPEEHRIGAPSDEENEIFEQRE